MTRYYYTDPFAAAWMERHFGMRFEDRKKLVNEIFYLGDSGYLADLDNSTKFYIHPDSLSLLEPKEGDLVGEKTVAGEGEVAVQQRIILRNGNVFHWPESEAA